MKLHAQTVARANLRQAEMVREITAVLDGRSVPTIAHVQFLVKAVTRTETAARGAINESEDPTQTTTERCRVINATLRQALGVSDAKVEDVRPRLRQLLKGTLL